MSRMHSFRFENPMPRRLFLTCLVVSSAGLTFLAADAHAGEPASPPEPGADAYAALEDTVLVIAAPGVLANDREPWLRALEVVECDELTEAGAIVTCGADGSFSYDGTGVPEVQRLQRDETLVETVTYTVRDTDGEEAAGTITVTVRGANDGPVVVEVIPDQTVAAGTRIGPVAIRLTDIDDELRDLRLSGTSDAQHIVSNGGVEFLRSDAGEWSVFVDPERGAVGEATVTVRVSDSTAVATTSFVVTTLPVPMPPQVTTPVAASTLEDTEAAPIVVEVSDDLTDPGSLEVSVRSSNPLVVAESGLLLEGSGTERELIITPVPDAFGLTNLTVTVTDGDGMTSTSETEVRVVAVDDPPVALPDSYAVAQGTRLVVAPERGLLANDEDKDSTGLRAELGDEALDGLVVSATGAFVYDAPADFTGTVTFNYLAQDNTSSSDPAVVTIEISEVDTDGDGIPDHADTCPQISNTDQTDLDEDGVGDLCDTDRDGDGVVFTRDCDDEDATAGVVRSWFVDADGDGLGDPADIVTICGDTVPEGVSDVEGDNCPSIANPDQANLDEDSLGDVCDADSDGDRIPETFDAESAPCANGNIEGCDDNCPLVRNTDQADANGDGIGDLCANDADGDYVEDALDLCPDEVGSRFMDGCPEPGVNGACSVGAGSERWGGAMWFVLTGLLTGLGRRRRRG